MIAKHVTAKFHRQGHLSETGLRKVLCQLYTLSKKRYCGIKHEPDGEGERAVGASHSGTANKRRDSCIYVHKIYDAMINPLLYDSDRKKSMDAFHEYMARIVGRVEYDDLVVTKSVRSSYKNTLYSHLKVIEKQRKRDAGVNAIWRSPRNDLCSWSTRSKISELAEDAEYVKANKSRSTLITLRVSCKASSVHS